MNKQRRKRINQVIEKVAALRDELGEVLEEEQNSFYNVPLNLQETECGEKSQEAISNLEEACSTLDDCVASLESAIE